MTITAFFLQAAPLARTADDISMWELLAKGGWVMVPLLILSALIIFIASDSWVTVRKMGNVDRGWFSHLLEQLRVGQYDNALNTTLKNHSALARVVRTGIESRHLPKTQIEEDMQIEARAAIARLEAPVGYLSMIASIAPMLGFLGTIFGVIKIFMDVSMTNELSISSISDGLYQKMICSAVGLLEGIVAYCAYYILNRRIDRIVLTLDRGANIALKAIAMPNDQPK